MPLSIAKGLATGSKPAAIVVGLTGGIGSGKSAAANEFAALGAAIVDTDAIAHELTGPHGAAMGAIATAFGKAALTADGALDRAAMRELAFADPGVRRSLEAILHPLIRAESERLIAVHASDAPYVVLVVPLLVESGDYRQRVDRIAVVDCDDETRIARVIARNGLVRTEIVRIMAAQASRAERLALADDVIENSGSLADLQARVAVLDAHYRTLSAAITANCRESRPFG
ncbi:MAG: dephospho-CoA kinase [Gammaproteobacteria bacterium]|nr:dephospho-CoA kinase [Gammaproteobacteria bacterium]MBU1645327.1 dephospho-CoA kinase [Gammaproteobacteria bacterium]MBU1972320.1 dephospho-CoA kinase [Gammaproteobacteria bacterium]